MYFGFGCNDYNFSIRFYNDRNLVIYDTQCIKYENDEFRDCVYCNPDIDDYLGSLLINFLNIDFKDTDSFKHFFEVWGYAGFCGISDVIKKANKSGFNNNNYNDFIKKALNDCRLNGGLEIAQKNFKNIVDFCFNTNRLEELKTITPSKRYFLADQKRKFNFESISQYSDSTEYESTAKPINSSDINFAELMDLDIPHFAKNIENVNIEFVDEYKTDNFLSICYLELIELIKKNASINKCENCEKYFIPQVRTNEIYCDKCKDIGYINKVKNDAYMTAYRNEYKSRNAKLRKITNPSKKELEKTLLKEWSKKAVQIARDKSVPIQDYKTWLKEV